jgi:NADP-dependent 3-hydroxy acid dehydrogenase YdfG
LRIITFGSSGEIGSVVYDELSQNNEVVKISSKEFLESVDKSDFLIKKLTQTGPVDGIVWAHGANFNDSISDVDFNKFDQIIDANIKFILIIVSSIWEKYAKRNKLSYTISKAAISGLVKSLALDLVENEIRVNAVLPGVVDNKMTRNNLNAKQILKFEEATPGGKLINALDLAFVINFLLDPKSRGINGQSIVVDNGWSINRD